MNFSELSNFTPQQIRATKMRKKHRYFLYGGRRGVLKSYWLRWDLLYALLRWAKLGFHNVRVMLACEDFPTLLDRQVSKIHVEFPKYMGVVKTTQINGFGFHLFPQYGSGSICFRSLDKPEKYRGSEWAAIAIDELTKHTEFIESEIRFFDVLDGSLRWPGITDSFFSSTSNPDGPGQIWVRDFFVERKLPEPRIKHKQRFGYMQGRREDDEGLLPQEYWDAIESVGSTLRQAWVEGDWYVEFGGYTFKRGWFEVVKQVSGKIVKVVRYWDKAGTEDGGKYTAGVLMCKTVDDIYYVLHVIRGRWSSGEREKVIDQTAAADSAKYGQVYVVGHEQEPGSGGKQSAESTTKMLAGYHVVQDKVSKSKDSYSRGLEPFACQAEYGNVKLVGGTWTVDYLDELVVCPHSLIRDQCDASGGAFNVLTVSGVGISI